MQNFLSVRGSIFRRTGRREDRKQQKKNSDRAGDSTDTPIWDELI